MGPIPIARSNTDDVRPAPTLNLLSRRGVPLTRSILLAKNGKPHYPQPYSFLFAIIIVMNKNYSFSLSLLKTCSAMVALFSMLVVAQSTNAQQMGGGGMGGPGGGMPGGGPVGMLRPYLAKFKSLAKQAKSISKELQTAINEECVAPLQEAIEVFSEINFEEGPPDLSGIEEDIDGCKSAVTPFTQGGGASKKEKKKTTIAKNALNSANKLANLVGEMTSMAQEGESMMEEIMRSGKERQQKEFETMKQRMMSGGMMGGGPGMSQEGFGGGGPGGMRGMGEGFGGPIGGGFGGPMEGPGMMGGHGTGEPNMGGSQGMGWPGMGDGPRWGPGGGMGNPGMMGQDHGMMGNFEGQGGMSPDDMRRQIEEEARRRIEEETRRRMMEQGGVPASTAPVPAEGAPAEQKVSFIGPESFLASILRTLFVR